MSVTCVNFVLGKIRVLRENEEKGILDHLKNIERPYITVRFNFCERTSRLKAYPSAFNGGKSFFRRLKGPFNIWNKEMRT